MPKLVVADPSLTDHRGHHFLLTNLVSEAARDAGYELIWLVNKRSVIESADELVTVIPVYSFTMYDKYRAVLEGGANPTNSDEITQEILDSLTGIGLTNEDHVLFHTTYYDIFEAFLRIYLAGNEHLLPAVHLCTPYDEKTMPGRPDDSSVCNLLKQLAKLPVIENKVYLWAETPQLANHFQDMLDVNVYALPLPVSNKLKTSFQANDAPDESLVKIVYLGAAREEKGFTLLPELVSLCFKDDTTRDSSQFIIQATPQIVGYNERILKAINELERFGGDFVTLIRDSLDEETYHEFLQQSDIVLLLYDKANYNIRGSGIAVEAASLGKCLLATKGTFCESLIERGGGLGINNPEEAFLFIRQYIQQPALFRIRGRQQAFFYNIQNSGQRYIDRLIYRSNAGKRLWRRPFSHLRQFSPFLVQ